MSRKGKELRSEKTPCEDFVKYDANMETFSGAEAMAASANSANTITPVTNEDILTAIHKMKNAVDESLKDHFPVSNIWRQ